MMKLRFSPSEFFKNKANIFMVILTVALAAFEVFNFSTTEYTFQSLLGGLAFGPLPWSVLLAVAFCGIDFAGVARLFTPETGKDEPIEVWYLFGAWLLGAAFNATLTWWGVYQAILDNSTSTVMTAEYKSAVAVAIAILVLFIRVLLIATFAMKADKLLNAPSRPSVQPARPQYTTGQKPVSAPNTNFRPQPAAQSFASRQSQARPGTTRKNQPQPSYTRVVRDEDDEDPTYRNPAGRL
jgi:hypothetical protein